MPKTTIIFDDVDHPKSRGVTYWAERIGPLVDHIIQFSCCAAFGAIQKNHMLLFEYFRFLKLGCGSQIGYQGAGFGLILL